MLTLSTRVRYATRIMVNIAMNQSGKPVRKHTIAREEGLSSDYVEQILVKLRTGGLVESRRGVAGGFVLGRAPASITVYAILEAVEGPISLVSCRDGCQRVTSCVTKPVWDGASALLSEYFMKTSVAMLAAEAAEKRRLAVSDYHI
jgi:Rrf2 family transcriptional regulator, cysteine metabolism repressor